MEAIPAVDTKTSAIFALSMEAASSVAVFFLASLASPAGLANARSVLTSEIIKEKDEFFNLVIQFNSEFTDLP